MNYSRNRASDECHKLEEFSFTWPPASVQAVSHDNSSDRNESKDRGEGRLGGSLGPLSA